MRARFDSLIGYTC